MASLKKLLLFTKPLSTNKFTPTLCLQVKNFSQLSLNNLVGIQARNTILPLANLNNKFFIKDLQICQFHKSQVNNDFMEFFDNEKNWGQNEVKVGRSWRKEELRLKSNTDLHKLWYVLLKERNMLLTMEHESKEKFKLFPNPERIDKIEESMKNLEAVVRERNEAYFLLETGESGERPGKVAESILGLKYYYKMSEHVVPKFINSSWKKKMMFCKPGAAVSKFKKLYREKLWNEKRKKRNRDYNHVVHLIKRFPNLDMEAVKEQYPTVDLERAKSDRKARGHSLP